MFFAIFEGHCCYDSDSEKRFVAVQGSTGVRRKVNDIN